MSHSRLYWWLVFWVAIAATLSIIDAAAGGAVSPSSPQLSTLNPQPDAAVVRITVYERADGTGGRYYGSGTVIDRDERGLIVLTCAHLFRGRPARVYVCAGRWGCTPAEILAIDADCQLAALGIADLGIEPVPIANEVPALGESLRICGYAADGQFTSQSADVVGYAEAERATEIMRGGGLGGPMFNRRGEVAAVMRAIEGRRILGIHCGRVRLFLQRILGRVPERPIGPPPGGGRVDTNPVLTPQTPLVPIAPPTSTPGAPATGPALSPPAAPASPGPLPMPPEDGGQCAGCPGLAAVRTELAPISEGIGRLEKAQQALAQSLETKRLAGVLRTEIDAAVVPIRERLDQQPAPGGADVDAIRQAVGEAVAGAATAGSWSAMVAPIFVALGWSTPPSAAALSAIWLAWRLIRRRGEKRSGVPSIPQPPPTPLRTGGDRDPAGQEHSADPVVIREDGAGVSAATLEAELAGARATIAELRKKLEAAPVRYLNPRPDDGLARMRQAMKVTSDTYPGARQWVQMIEKVYTLLLSGEAHGN